MSQQVDYQRLLRLAERYSRTLTNTGTADLLIHIVGPAPEEIHWRPDCEPKLVETTPDGESIYRFFTLAAGTSVLKIASPVFKRMLTSGNFMEAVDGDNGVVLVGESKGTGIESPKREITLKDDHPLTILTVMVALHHQNGLAPKQASFEMLGHLALACDKYEVQEALQPWIQLWTLHMLNEEEADGNWLFEAWALRHNAMFKMETRFWILNAALTKDGELELSDTPEASEGLRDIYLKRIMEKRITLLQTIFTVFTRHRDDYINAMKHQHDPVCKNRSESCDIFNFGVLARGIMMLGFDNGDIERYPDSVHNVVETAIAMENVYHPEEICCEVGKTVAARVKQAVGSMKGLDLEDVVVELHELESRRESKVMTLPLGGSAQNLSCIF